jgi:hypothetical protein
VNGRRWLLLVTAITAGVLVTGLAVAGPAPLDDPNDVSGRLDVRTVTFDPEAGPPTWTVLTFSTWTVRELWDRGFFLVRIDTMGSSRPDYYALVRSTGTELEGSLWRDTRRGADRFVRFVTVTKASGGRIAVEVPFGSLEFGATRASYRWSVVTLYTGEACRRTCIDHVPDAGAVTQPLGTPTPTVTPSPTATTTPTPTAATG